MNRHSFIPSLLSACAFLPAAPLAAREKPNIVIIHTDEQNFRTLGCYRQYLSPREAFPWGEGNNVETPHIDGLARGGVLFNRCYATSPVSGPCRASFLTGLYPQHAGVMTNDMELAHDATTFGEILRANGYATAYIGKLHLAGKERPGWQPARDFGFTDRRYMYNRGHWKKIAETPDGPEFRPHDRVQTADSLTYPTDYFTNRALEFIRSRKDRPFCCMLSLPDPHSANVVRPPYDRMYREMTICKPLSAFRDTTGLPAWAHGDGLPADRMEDMAQYFGMVKCIDDNVGRIVAALREEGLLEKTIIVFTSDHGDMCGRHGLINKCVPYDDAARVAFVVSYPGGMPRGECVNHVMSVADFVPSLVAFLGLTADVAFDGRDLSSLWQGKPLPASCPDETFMRAPTTSMLPSDWDEVGYPSSLPATSWSIPPIRRTDPGCSTSRKTPPNT